MITTRQKIERIANGIKHEIKKVDSSFENDPSGATVEDAIATATAPSFTLLEKGIDEAVLQGCPLTATSKKDSSNGQGEAWGRVKLLRDPFPAVPAEYTITITGTGTVPAGMQYIDNITEFVYLLQADVVCTGTGTGTVKSVGTGIELVKTVGTKLYAQKRITGINEEVVIASVVTLPVEEESFEEYQRKTVESFANTPRGGSVGDYRVWGLTVSGVMRVFPYNKPASGRIYIQAEITDSNEYGIPTSALLSDVEDEYELHDSMATGELEILPVAQTAYQVEVQGLTDITKQSLILPELKAYFVEKYPYIDPLDDEELRTDLVLKADIYKIVADAVYPASITGIVLRSNSVVINDEYLPEGSIGVPSVIFS